LIKAGRFTTVTRIIKRKNSAQISLMEGGEIGGIVTSDGNGEIYFAYMRGDKAKFKLTADITEVKKLIATLDLALIERSEQRKNEIASMEAGNDAGAE